MQGIFKCFLQPKNIIVENVKEVKKILAFGLNFFANKSLVFSFYNY